MSIVSEYDCKDTIISSLAVFDINNDGYSDIVLTDSIQKNIKIFFNSANGQLGKEIIYSVRDSWI